MNEITAAYVAGIIDGEGCITIAKSTKKGCKQASYQPHIVVCMTSEPVVQYLTSVISGGWRTIQQPKNNNRLIHRFVVTGESAYTLIERIKPYLIEKQAQAEKFLELRAYSKGQGYRASAQEVAGKDTIYTELKAMHL